jgi:TAG lipase/steryl ester hydrolase/phospholipase A2/LPA acyltransferase
MLSFKYNSFFGMLLRIFKGEALLDGKAVKDRLRDLAGDLTFKEIHDKYKWNLNITVTDSKKTDEARLLNYLTAPNVVAWTAAAASCSIPYFFDPVELLVKNENGEITPYHPNNTNTTYIDGSIGGDLPMQRMSELFNVNTFIVSQVNPHVVPWIAVDGGGILATEIRKKLSMTLKAFIGNEVKHLITQLDTLGVLPLTLKKLSTLITQSYKGHVTIVPGIEPVEYFSILTNPTY